MQLSGTDRLGYALKFIRQGYYHETSFDYHLIAHNTRDTLSKQSVHVRHLEVGAGTAIA
jgi:hypothetical protein